MANYQDLLKKQKELDERARGLGVSSLVNPTPAAAPPGQEMSTVATPTPAAVPPGQQMSTMATPTSAAVPPGQQGGYRIQGGDTLSGIAARTGLTVQQIMAANPQITDPNKIYEGQMLNLPGVPAQSVQPQARPQIQPQARSNVQPQNQQQSGMLPPTPSGVKLGGTEEAPIPEVSKPEVPETVNWASMTPQGVATKLGEMGVPYSPEVMGAFTAQDADIEKITQDIYDQYGITDLETKFTEQPEKTFEDIYSKAFEDAGLADLKTEIDDLRAKIAKAEADRDEAIGTINENPWLSEASRVGRAKRVSDKAQRELDRLTNQLTLVDTMYGRGKEEAENIATRALNTFAVNREYAKEELDYYVKRAEADVQAKLAVMGTEAEKEKYRYFPEYLKAYQPEVEADLLSPTEAATLGVPYGTTKSQAAAMGITPERWKETADVNIFTPKQTADLEIKLGNNFERYVKNARVAMASVNTIEIGYNAIRDVIASGEGSLNAPSQAMLVTFQKMLDPTSVVRESEYARSGTGLSLVQRINGIYTKLVSGGAGISAKDLDEFYNLSVQLQGGYQSQMVNYAERTKKQAESYGLNLENILTPDVIDMLGQDMGAPVNPVSVIGELEDEIQQVAQNYRYEWGREDLIDELSKVYSELTKDQIADKVYKLITD